MLKYASRQVKESMAKGGDNSLESIRAKNRTKYRDTLKFMQEWTSDLM